MLKKLAVPFLALVISTLGACSSDSPASGTGGSGSGGSGSGGSGSGGSGSGGTGSGGSGSGGAASGGATVEAGTDMAMETAMETATETAAETGEVALAACTVSTNTTPTEKLSAEDFCANFISFCGDVGGASPYKTMATCLTSYNANAVPQQHCQSYHLCWGVEGKGGGPAMPPAHCPHATGMGPCVP